MTPEFSIETKRGGWLVKNGTADLLFRGKLPGASGYDHAAHALRIARAEGIPCVTLLPLALPTSWMVNAKALSTTFQAWLAPPLLNVWAHVFELLPSSLGVNGWLELPSAKQLALTECLRQLAAPKGASLAAISKVLALFRPELVPLMDDAALWFALDALDEPTSADDPRASVDLFVPMLDWFAHTAREHEPALIALAVAHTEHVYDAPQVLDRLLWVASWGSRGR
jgi:hypothetical protein